QTREADLALMYSIAKEPPPATPDDVPFHLLVPSFILSEVKTAFQMGFILFLPFLVIDMVIASVLISMGMFTLPPIVISTPFKVLLFILVDGWNIVIDSAIKSFYT
ncbi:MAG: flagellar biosynthetic protein FliP, partial [Planctomycetota bacterium]